MDVINTKINSIHIIVELKNGEDRFVVVDDLGNCALVTLKDKQVAMGNQGKKSRVKKVARLGDNWGVFYQGGDIHLMD